MGLVMGVGWGGGGGEGGLGSAGLGMWVVWGGEGGLGLVMGAVLGGSFYTNVLNKYRHFQSSQKKGRQLNRIIYISQITQTTRFQCHNQDFPHFQCSDFQFLIGFIPHPPR